ncbi:MAG: hypothetical protein JRN15_20455 [Nitrososphaerota archaeon]|nr:hypothetical protein [Nitrososphaerota archaeon]
MDDKKIIIVAPNGAELPFEYRPEETVDQLLARATAEFAARKVLDKNVDYMLVFGDKPLDGKATIKAAGVKPGDKLKIRSRTIPGDGHASSIL